MSAFISKGEFVCFKDPVTLDVRGVLGTIRAARARGIPEALAVWPESGLAGSSIVHASTENREVLARICAKRLGWKEVMIHESTST